MEYDLLLVDGYNLMYQDNVQDRGDGRLVAIRDRLVRRIERGAAGLAPRIEVVFDGRDRGGIDPAFDTDAVRVVFSPSGRTADGWIEQRVHDAEAPERILVVTSDSVERRLVTVFGASVMSCREFLLRCDSPQQLSKAMPGRTGRGGRSTLGEFFPG